MREFRRVREYELALDSLIGVKLVNKPGRLAVYRFDDFGHSQVGRLNPLAAAQSWVNYSRIHQH